MVKMLTIREFLKLACIGALAGVLAACGSKPVNVQVVPTVTKTFTPIPTNTPEPTATNTPEVTPTEAPKFTKENISIIPTSMADIPRLVEVPNPLDNPVQFDVAMNKILTVVRENIMPNFKGNYFEPGKQYPDHHGTLTVSTDTGSLMIRDELEVVASFKYKVGSQNGVGLFVLMMDKGKVIPMVIMTDPFVENYISNTGNTRRSLTDLLKMLKDNNGVMPMNYEFSTQIFYKKDEFTSPFGAKFLDKYGSGSTIENWNSNYSSTFLDETKIIYGVYLQSAVKK